MGSGWLGQTPRGICDDLPAKSPEGGEDYKTDLAVVNGDFSGRAIQAGKYLRARRSSELPKAGGRLGLSLPG